MGASCSRRAVGGRRARVRVSRTPPARRLVFGQFAAARVARAPPPPAALDRPKKLERILATRDDADRTRPMAIITTRFLAIDAPAGERPARLAVHTAGRGPLALLLHGYPLDHRMWLDVLHGPLAQHRTLCAVDLRGHGASPWAGDPVHTMERFADDAALVIRSLADGPVDVCGLSMGGYVALALCERHKELVRSLVLSNTRAGADNDTQRAGRDAAIATVTEQGRAAIFATMAPKLLGRSADVLRRAQLRTMIADQPVETFVADLRGMQTRADRTPLLATLELPALVIAGEHDQLMPAAEGERMAAAIRGARFAIVRDSAHLSPLEQPDAWSSAVAPLWN